MNLNDFQQKNLKEVVEQMDLKDLKVHMNDTGNIVAIELKYIPKDVNKEIDTIRRCFLV